MLNGVNDPDHANQLVIDTGKAEDFLVYSKPFVATSFDSINRRPQIWINQVGYFNAWPLKVRSLSHCESTLRARAEALIPPIVSLDPQADSTSKLKFEYDFPLIWKLVFCVATFLALILGAIVLYTNLGGKSSTGVRVSWFDPLLSRFEVASEDISRKNLFLIACAPGLGGNPLLLAGSASGRCLATQGGPRGRARGLAGRELGRLCSCGAGRAHDGLVAGAAGGLFSRGIPRVGSSLSICGVSRSPPG